LAIQNKKDSQKMMNALSTENYASKADIQSAFERLKEVSQQTPYPSYKERLSGLTKLQDALLKHETSLLDALQKDFGCRAHEESRILELIPTLGEIKHAKRHLKKWMRPERRSVHISSFPASAKIFYQPKGVIGVISPWNYPVLLSLGPLVGALSAGNRAMLKLSEFCPETNTVLRRIVNEALGDKWVEVVEGEADAANALSSQPLDHLLFTGSTSVGRIVMQNAAKNLTPVTLELGGKSPLLVAQSADLRDVAEKLVFGKLVNAGQTCVAPDYVLCHHTQKQTLVDHIKEVVDEYYPQGILSPDYTSIINERQLARLKAYLENATELGAICENLMPESGLEKDGKLAFHIVRQPTDDMDVMKDEIFGPILPILVYSEIQSALSYIHSKPRPLSMYVFSKEESDKKLCEEQIVSGSLVMNHTLIQVAQPDLPFGGVGPSGMGVYHAEEGFKTFSHGRSVLDKKGFNSLKLLKPPYDRGIHKLVARFWPFL